MSSKYSTCAFCHLDFKGVYKCPKCKKDYCNLKCYRSKEHMECSNAFYQDQIARHVGKELEETDSDDQSVEGDELDEMDKATTSEEKVQKQKEEDNKAEADGKQKDKAKSHMTFSEYMSHHSAEDRLKTEEELNPDIGLRPGEELVIDEDDDPEYIQEVVESSMKDFENLTDEELDQKLKEMGMDPEKEDELFGKLTADERKSFQRIADEMFGIKSTSAFNK
ncbi:unnamed protein product [Bursaphelenchus xylophilus]|uniref:(pine wood nematode) hypothetical protein n=1 Tax=Bursaphelenchus xylophilus TaxID=6326 RepID=A0A1I7S4C1_BURXY|nr:unnamed protein product [Bursaphelenchus xylophilus]CAG9116938.1 unnamed protein product [Bursaphelenchus xylophilus]